MPGTCPMRKMTRGKPMEFGLTPRCEEMRAELISFMDEFVYPNEETFEEQLDKIGRAHV